MKLKSTFSDKAFDILNHSFMAILTCLTLYPIIYIISISFSDISAVMENEITFYPIGFNLASYKKVFSDSDVWLGYRNTIFYTTFGTLFKLTGVTMLAYPLSKKRLLFRNAISYYCAFTLYFGGGLVPSYLLKTQLGLRNTVWVILIGGAVSTYHAILLRTFFQGIPDDLEESAKMDGMGNIGILWRIYIPLSKPIYATLTLFFVVGHWNSYFDAILYLDKKELQPLQVYLQRLISTGFAADVSAQNYDAAGSMLTNSQSITAATIIVAMVPIMLIYPFLQKYFVKGMMVGSIKG